MTKLQAWNSSCLTCFAEKSLRPFCQSPGCASPVRERAVKVSSHSSLKYEAPLAPNRHSCYALRPSCLVGESSYFLGESLLIVGESSFFVTSAYLLRHRIYVFSTSFYFILWWVYRGGLRPLRAPGQKHLMGPHHKTTDICHNI